MAVVYKHIRKDTGQPFYIGIGKTIKRAYSKKYRNNLWFKIVKKYGYEIEILHTDITWDEACQLEKNYIKKYGRIDLSNGILSNLTDGGEGLTNISDKTRQKMSNSHKGKIISEQTKQKMADASRNRIVKNSTRQKISKIHKNKIVSVETKKKMSESKKDKYNGKNNPMFGKKHSDITKSKISNSRQNSNHPLTILTKNDVLWIRENYKTNDKIYGCRAMSRKFNIDAGSISKIINYKTWKHV